MKIEPLPLAKTKTLKIFRPFLKGFICLSFLVISFFASAQGFINSEPKFSLGLNFSPNYSYRNISYPEGTQNMVISIGDYEQASFGFNTGITAQYLIARKFEIDFGVQFSRQTHMHKDLRIADANSNSLGLLDVEYRYHYIEIPLRLNYRIINKKLFAYVTAGASLNQYLNNEQKVWPRFDTGESKTTFWELEDRYFNKTTIGLVGGLGMGYHLNRKLNLRAEPLFRYSLTPLQEAPIKQFNYSIGCQIALNMKF